MRVVHVASGREWRGGQRQVVLLARTLAPLGVDQVVVTGHGTRLAEALGEWSIPVRGVAWDLSLDPRVLPGLLAAAAPADAVVHAHDAHALRLAAWGRRGRPFVATRRVAFPLRHPRAWRRVDRVVAVSDAVATQLVRDGIPPHRIAHIPSAVDAASLRRDAGDGRLPDGIGRPCIVVAAALTSEKGHPVLLDALAQLRERLPTASLAVAGEGGERARLEARAARLGLTHAVHFLGHVASPAGLLAAADVVVLPSLSEGLGTVILEALAVGTPVVASATGGAVEAVGRAGLLVPPGDPRALAGALERVLTDAGLRARLVAEAPGTLARFDADAMARAMLAVYRSVSLEPEGP